MINFHVKKNRPQRLLLSLAPHARLGIPKRLGTHEMFNHARDEAEIGTGIAFFGFFDTRSSSSLVESTDDVLFAALSSRYLPMKEREQEE
jgi:hypothetical protein